MDSDGVKPDGNETPSTAAEASSPKPRGGRLRWIGGGVAVVVIAVAAIVIASSGGGEGGPLNAIAKAAEVTQAEPGGHATLTAKITSSAKQEGITETGSMVFDEAGQAEGTVNVSVGTTGLKFAMTTIVDGETVYMTSPALESKIPEGKKWMKLDLSAAAAEAGSSGTTAGGPSEGLKVLEDVEGAEEVGKEEIDGVATTRYKGTLPVAKKVFGVEIHDTAQEVEVWIDGQDRVRKMQLLVTGSAGESKETATNDVTINFFEFGKVPAIKPPAPDEVFDATGQIESEIQSIH
jgi:hypothetical protein